MADDRGPSRASGAGLTAIYGWYERNAALVACVLRDFEYHEVTQQIVELRFGPSMAFYREVLGERLGAEGQASCCSRSATSRGARSCAMAD